jgi:ABC-type cobalamin/Fe3+-siderophores transport system ATPase subunit
VENLTKSYGEQVLFENISFTIEEGRRVALVAKNGTGKTTLLNIIAGKESHDAGSVVPRRGLRIAYLEQSPAYPAGMTVLEACFHAANPALKAIAEYERAIGNASGEGLQEAMARMDALEAWDYEQRAKRILSRLRIRDFGQKVETLSGGQLKRVALANVLISESDLLILDEPTNHLDLKTKEILKEALMAFDGTLIVVSHDKQVVFRQGQKTQHIVLDRVDILKFIHQDILKLFLPAFADIRPVGEKLMALEHHIIEIQLSSPLQFFLVGIENCGKTFLLQLSCVFLTAPIIFKPADFSQQVIYIFICRQGIHGCIHGYIHGS